MNQYEIFEKREIKKVSLIVGLTLLLAYFVENILSTALMIVFAFLGFSADGINELLLNPWIGYSINSFLVIIACTLTLCLLKFAFKQPISKICMFNAPKRKNFLTCIGFAFGFSFVANVITAVFNLVLKYVFKFEATIPELGSDTTGDAFEFIFILICSSVVPALVEEFAFRGMILGSLRRFGDIPAILVSSILFAVFHGNFVQIPFALSVGIILGLIVVISGSIWTAIISHFLINAYAVIANELLNDYAYQISILFYVLILVGVVCMIRLISSDAFKEIKSRHFVLSTRTKFFTMLFAPSVIIFIGIMIYTALKFKV